MNLGQATTELQARGFSYQDPSRVTIALNNAKNALEDEYSWPWLETTTTGPAPLTIADLKSVLYVVDTTNQAELPGVDARDVVDLDPTIGTVGSPAVWWLDGVSTLRLYPTSVSVQLSVRYVKFSPELSAPSDTPLIPARFHAVWIDYAVAESYKDDDNFGAAQALLGDVRQRRLPQMIDTYAARNHANQETQVIVAGSEDG